MLFRSLDNYIVMVCGVIVETLVVDDYQDMVLGYQCGVEVFSAKVESECDVRIFKEIHNG